MKARGNRHQVVLATKAKGRMWEGPNGEGLSRLHIMRAAEESLRRLQTDYIDLYQSHSFDRNTPIEETMRAFDDLVRAGKVRYVGCSNYPAWRLVEALWTSGSQGLVSYISLQPHYNLVRRQEFEQDLADVVEGYGLGVIPYSPLASGFLTGKYRRGEAPPDSARAETVQKRYFREENFQVLDRMEEIGRAQGKSLPQVALAWLLANPLVTAPIIGANSLEQLQTSLGAAGFRLDAAEKQALDEVTAWQAA
jgi:aryl-alcohol dehydrogenase-like predicted oxidoreductase